MFNAFKWQKGEAMSYYFAKILDISFEEAMGKVVDELKKKGFGILTQIDVQETLKKKLDVDFPRYHILGACNPPFAHRALQAERMIGLMLPCNVVVQETGGGKTEVSAVDPVSSMQAVPNPKLLEVAREVQGKLKKVIAGL
jgi:uncharacterized protein (DUF302 family)